MYNVGTGLQYDICIPLLVAHVRDLRSIVELGIRATYAHNTSISFRYDSSLIPQYYTAYTNLLQILRRDFFEALILRMPFLSPDTDNNTSLHLAFSPLYNTHTSHSRMWYEMHIIALDTNLFLSYPSPESGTRTWYGNLFHKTDSSTSRRHFRVFFFSLFHSLQHTFRKRFRTDNPKGNCVYPAFKKKKIVN